jgi:glycosyltransferase involved in cell wall biosynthesis
MKNSVLVVAHNEEKTIERCLVSISRQTLKPDEVVVVAHNCNDRTVELARKYPVRVVEFQGPVGVVFARIKGFEEVRGDIVACIDGDAYADEKWLERLTKPLADKNVSGTGGLVYLTNSFYQKFISFRWFLLRTFVPGLKFYFWGANFACRRGDYFKIGGLEPFIEIKEQLDLNFWCDDYYLSTTLGSVGRVKPTLTAVVYSRMDDGDKDFHKKNDLRYEDYKKMLKYFRGKQ